MNALPIILTEIDKLPTSDLRMLLHLLLDKILTAEKSAAAPTGPKPSIKKYRGAAKGIWAQDAQAYINQLRNDERF